MLSSLAKFPEREAEKRHNQADRPGAASQHQSLMSQAFQSS